MTGEAERPVARLASPDRLVAVVLAAVCYVPLLLTDVGKVSADTKTYLTLDPGDLLRSATSMWDPTVGAGTVPHQNIGYLFPLGPYYWVMEQLAVPDWITQRLLWGTLAFAASYGTYRLLRWLGWEVTAAFVAGLAYGLSPYLLSYIARLSAIIGPWAAMPWMILLAAKAARTRSWRPAAWFAVVVALVGSVNATALVFAGLGPVLWLVADAVAGRVRAAAALRAAAKIGLLTALVSAWWIVGLSVQGGYGIPILRYTESYEAVASASTPPEVLRGLGYWFFYGGDVLGNWVGPATAYIDAPLLIALGFVVAGASLLGLLVPFAGRAVAALWLLVGLAISVGAAPPGESTLYGSAYQGFADSTVGLALRSTTRAAPLVVLPLAMGLGSASSWAARRIAERDPDRARRALLAPAGACVLVALQMFPWFTGSVLTPSILRDEDLPAYETELAAWLDANGTGRVYELPGSDFASHRWGGTVDPVLPGIIDRPYLSRELVPQGGAATADLLNAFERRLADGWFEPESLEPVMGLLDAETVVTRNDLQHERYRLARPGPLWTDVTGELGDPEHAGPDITDEPEIPFVDSLTLSRPDEADVFPAVAAFDLAPAPAVSTYAASTPMVVAGSGDGLVDLAAAGLLDEQRPVLYAATLDDLVAGGDVTSDELGRMVGSDPWWVVTDTNRRQGRHWSTLGSNLGAVETATAVSLQDDPSDNRLELFDEQLDNQTVAAHRGDVADVRASYFGNQIAYTPEDAPWFAIDGDPTTAWRIGVFEPTAGLRWEVDLVEPAPTSTVTLLQPITGAVDRFITRARVTVDGEHVDVVLDDRSRTPPGQEVQLPVEEFQQLSIEVLADNVGPLSSYAGRPGVGFAEVVIPGVVDDRVLRVPDLTTNAAYEAAAADDQRTTFVFTRERIDPATSNRTAPEPAMHREFEIPVDGAYDLSGESRLASDAPDELLQAVLGEQVAAVADRRLEGNVGARGASALDGDPATAWSTPLDRIEGATLTIVPTDTVTGDLVEITWLDDGEHSVPTAFRVLGDDGTDVVLHVDDARAVSSTGEAVTASFDIDTIDASSVQLVIESIRPVTSEDYYSGAPRALPVALAEVRIGDDLPLVDGPTVVDTGCRDDLLLLDGEPLTVRVTGDRDSALGRGELTLESCDGDLDLAAGRHRLDAVRGVRTGFDLDRVVLDRTDHAGPPAAAAPAAAIVDDSSRTSLDAHVPAAEDALWLTLNQSWNEGWQATVDGEDLGDPVLVDGYKNGWLLPAADGERTIELRWTPQRTVLIGMLVSLFGALLVLVILLMRRRAPVAESSGPHRPLWRRDSRIAAAALLVLLVIVGGPSALVAAAATLLVLPRVRWFPTIAVLVVGGLTAGAIVVLEWYRDYPVALFWPSHFSWAAPWTWAVVAVVVTAAVFPCGVRLRDSVPTSCER